MKSCRLRLLWCLFLVVSIGMPACLEKKQGKVIISHQEFILRKDSDHSYAIDAKGRITNVGEVDVKNIVVTGYCRSCGEIMIAKKWFVGAEKMPEQKDTISRLAAGGETEFHFKGVADMYSEKGAPAPALPDQLEAVVESFETAEN
jgi:hypothetical protein